MNDTLEKTKEKPFGVHQELYDEILGKGGSKKVEFKSVDIVRSGTKIILPEGMGYDDARKWLKRKEESEEQQVNFNASMKAYPFDGAYAMYKAITNLFGFADLTSVNGPSGAEPPEMIDIKLPDGSHIKVPWGRMQFPGMDSDSYLETKYNNATMEFKISGKIKRKFEEVTQKIADETQRILAEESIYKGKAFKVDLSFMENTNVFPPNPNFIDVSKVKWEDILLTKTARKDFSSVLLRIQRTDECIKNKIPLKHGCLLAGPYGTGKTFLARGTSKIAVENNWTFIYLEQCSQLKNALRLAEMYAPAVIFAEDIDKATEGTRTAAINDILNTLDGMDTKDKPIITILTTNHLENINKAFLRAGRIDSLILMGALDEDTALEFIKKFARNAEGKSIIYQDKDYSIAAKSLSGIVPAFATEVINKAKMYAMYREGGKSSKLTPEDIEVAAESFKQHIALTEGKKEKSKAEITGETFITLFGPEKVEEILHKVKNL